jgi:outer membrane protein OmpA-like peptidoglycan-associated protein/opacity protein-like surface antigen
MKLCVRMIATMTVAISLTPTVLLHAQGTGRPLVGAMDSAVDSSVTPSSGGQSAMAASASISGAEESITPRVELFLGYSYFRAVPTDAAGNRMVDLNGGSASVAFNLNRYLGIVADFGGYNDTRLRFTGPGANPPGTVDSSGTAYTYLFGPRISFRNHTRITPFAQVLFGGVHASEVTLSDCTGPGCTPLPSQNSFALTAGGGFDIGLSRHISIRAIQAEYMMTRFADLTTGGGNTQNDLRLSSGLVFRFGGNPPPSPPPPPPPVAQAVVQTEPKPNQPPTMNCQADRNTVTIGEPVQITATANDSDNDLLTFSWNSNGGQIIGSGSSVKFDTSGVAAGQYTVTGHTSDGRGGTADCLVNIEAQAAAPPLPTPLELRLALHSIYFPTARPTLQNPDGGLLASQKQTLTALAGDFKTYLESKPSARLILEGHADPRASVEYNQALSERRVASTKSFLIGLGIPAANIETKAFGEQQNLTGAQVKDAVDRSPELTPVERQKVLDNITTIILASNRRVDVTLSTTGQQSVRQYPFNAADSLTLLSQRGGQKRERPAAKKATPAAE